MLGVVPLQQMRNDRQRRKRWRELEGASFALVDVDRGDDQRKPDQQNERTRKSKELQRQDRAEHPPSRRPQRVQREIEIGHTARERNQRNEWNKRHALQPRRRTGAAPLDLRLLHFSPAGRS